MTDPKVSDEDDRADFPSSTKELLAKRSGYICGYPGCRRMTVAGSDDKKSGLTLTGVAAHITAASRKGPRYDANMSAEERTGESNGFWACQIHGKFIDDNPSRCTVEELHRWKSQHEKWVFDRVESGAELFNQGIYRIGFANVGIFKNQYCISLGRHNILVGLNESGKSTLCQTLAAFSGEPHWSEFVSRFDFDKTAFKRSFVTASHHDDGKRTTVKLSPQLVNPSGKKGESDLQRIHVELNGNPSVSWPTSLFKALYFENQFQPGAGNSKGQFETAIGYLSSVLSIHEDLVWDSLRDELFATSMFGYRFRRKELRKVDILVPDGRTIYLPHGNLSTSELHLAFVDIALKLVLSASASERWMLIFDTTFFGRLDRKAKTHMFDKLTNFSDDRFQTIFCLNSSDDAETLKSVQSDKWVNATRLNALTLHAFL